MVMLSDGGGGGDSVDGALSLFCFSAMIGDGWLSNLVGIFGTGAMLQQTFGWEE